MAKADGYKYKSGNERRKHPNLIHPGYFGDQRFEAYPQVKPEPEKKDDGKQGEAGSR